MRYRPVKKPAPMPENPYHRIFTPMPSFEDLVRKAREEEKKLKNNKKLRRAAKTDGRQIFARNIFPQLFDDAAQEAYVESTETYTKLFEDAGKYRAIMNALAQAMFDELKNEEVTE